MAQIAGLFGCFTPRAGYKSLASLGILTSPTSSAWKACKRECSRFSSHVTFTAPFMNDLGVRANIHGHFETSVRLKECLFRSVRACFCPDGPHYRRNGDVTGLRFDPLDGNTAPQCVGQWLGCSESDRNYVAHVGSNYFLGERCGKVRCGKCKSRARAF
ncbi:hypothetical protein FN846DRAFT_402862 [Sphaerosporella brunnea]|uniref:Uncharacterized protein n=1 Tax=Sphaerosporella brunnea TaxID=1250544 RepID=A0A5J5EIR4_9PEZI|nr:hypothetical protein FN846DRAFT_402862 [Sphaerosporella brunnea]